MYICYFLVGVVKGEKTILNIVTGAGEFSGMFFSGFLMNCFDLRQLSAILLSLYLAFMACIYFLGHVSPLTNYISLYCCITMMAGAFNVAFVMVEERTMP